MIFQVKYSMKAFKLSYYMINVSGNVPWPSMKYTYHPHTEKPLEIKGVGGQWANNVEYKPSFSFSWGHNAYKLLEVEIVASPSLDVIDKATKIF